MLQAGQTAPDFDLPDADLRKVSLSSQRGQRHVVLYFYPKDDTSGCTLEALDFTNLADDFERAGCVVESVACTARYVAKPIDFLLNLLPTRYVMFNAFLVARRVR